MHDSVPFKQMDSNKSPGTDGIPAEFFKTFWDELSPVLVDALITASIIQDNFVVHRHKE